VAAAEVLSQLATVDLKPDDPEAVRQLILCGLRLDTQDAPLATRLLRHWTDAQPDANAANPAEALASWQQWFAETYPDAPPAETPQNSHESAWSYDELLGYLTSPNSQGDPDRGALIYEKARCAKCHRFGRRGEPGGPELTTVAQRFHKKEILEAVLFPSHVISDQYASQTVVTKDGKTFVGIVAPAGEDHVSILQPTAEKITIARDQIESIEPHRASAMPEGLLNNLTLQEIADLFAYLSGPTAQISLRPVDGGARSGGTIQPAAR
jgi:putative heme-binding domain-containing protein